MSVLRRLPDILTPLHSYLVYIRFFVNTYLHTRIHIALHCIMPSFKKLVAKLRSRSGRPASGNDNRASTTNGNAPKSGPAPVPAAVQADQQVMAASTTPTLTVTLRNSSGSSAVYVYVTGQALDNGNRAMFLQSDGKTIYYPASPASVGSPLAADVAIPLGAPGTTKNITIPRIAGGRVWFAIGGKLTFALNPGPGVVEVETSHAGKLG